MKENHQDQEEITHVATKDPEDRKAGSIKDQIAVLEKDFNPKKLILLIPAVLLIALCVFLLKPKLQSQLTITGFENKFKVDFQLSNPQRSLAEFFLQGANIQQNILNGFEFALDGTSSAKLGYISPIYTQLAFQKDRINFNGTTQAALLNDAYEIRENFKLPQSANIVVFGQDLVPFIKKNVTLGQDFETWTDENLKSSSGQYLALFGDQPDFVLIFKKDSGPDFEKLKTLKTTEGAYREETQDDTTFHLTQFFTFFQMDDNIFVTSSLDTAKELAKIQKDESQITSFLDSTSKVAFAFVIISSPDNKADNALKFLVGDEQKATQYLEKVKTVGFYLNGKQFHGEVEI